MKTLALILHHNTPEYTDQLFEMLNPYKGWDYDLIVVDNGSEPNKTSKYTNFSLDYNVYFGGGLNVAFNYILENSFKIGFEVECCIFKGKSNTFLRKIKDLNKKITI